MIVRALGTYQTVTTANNIDLVPEEVEGKHGPEKVLHEITDENIFYVLKIALWVEDAKKDEIQILPNRGSYVSSGINKNK